MREQGHPRSGSSFGVEWGQRRFSLEIRIQTFPGNKHLHRVSDIYTKTPPPFRNPHLYSTQYFALISIETPRPSFNLDLSPLLIFFPNLLFAPPSFTAVPEFGGNCCAPPFSSCCSWCSRTSLLPPPSPGRTPYRVLHPDQGPSSGLNSNFLLVNR